MIALQAGDRLPIVAAVQMLLNRALGSELISVDGDFGPETAEAVRQFHQLAGRPALPLFGVDDWELLIKNTRVSVVSAVDVYDPQQRAAIPAYLWGRGLIETGGMSNGVVDIIGQVRLRVLGPKSLVLLRFFGHGMSGLMSVSAGTGSLRDSVGRSICHVGGAEGFIAERASHDEPAMCVIDSGPPSHGFELAYGLHGAESHAFDRTTISLETVTHLRQSLARLRPLFAPMGSVELHGCHVGAGTNGLRLLRRLADIFGVPVSAGVDSQLFGELTAPRFEDAVRTAFPHGGDLNSWCGNLRGVALPL